jgi:hypothetical protein
MMSNQGILSRFEIDRSATQFLVLSIAFMLIWYTFCITDGTFHVFRVSGNYGFVFNSMLRHLTRGQFDVDPAAAGFEGFARDGRTFSYFGILLALLRLPLLPLGALETTDITRISIVLAATAGGFFKLRATIAVFRRVPAGALRDAGFFALTLSIVLGGPQIQFLKVSIYQEPVVWGGAFAAGFVFMVVRALLDGRGFTARVLAVMALFAGLALLTRVTFGLGLYVALELLVVILSWPGLPGEPRSALRFASRLFSAPNLLAGAILLVFATACGVVNYYRWGSPFTFADFHLQLFLHRLPERVPRFDRYGEFNVSRLWFGLMYFFVPVWVFFGSDGQFLFHDFQTRLFDQVELPPSSFLVTDPLLIVLTVTYGYSILVRQPRGVPAVAPAAAVLTGLAIPMFLMMTAISLAFRYRGEFYPFFELAAFLGFYTLCAAPLATTATAEARMVRLLRWSAIGGAVMAHLMLVFYKFSPFGEVRVTSEVGWLRFYYWNFMVHPWF